MAHTLAQKEELVLRRIKTEFGYPVIDIEVEDEKIKQNFLITALIDYYRAKPFEYAKSITGSSGVVIVDIPDLTNVYGDSTELVNDRTSYFIGVVGMNREPSIIHSDITTLTGVSLPIIDYGAGGYIWDMSDEIMESMHQATIQDLFENDLLINYDPIKEQIHVSQFSGTVSLILGYGFNTLDFVPYKHLNVIAMLTARHLARSLRVARGSIDLQSEIGINEDILTETITRLDEEIPREMESIATPLLLYA